MPFTYDYPRPAVTVDVALFAPAGQMLRVLLIQRRQPPFKGSWAFPGGFLDMDEELSDAARRELREETGLEVGTLLELGAYGKVGRDPRGRTLSIAYLALYPGNLPQAEAGDDAAAVAWFYCNQLPGLAFDHSDLLTDALKKLKELADQPARLCHELLAPDLSFNEMHAVFEAVLGRSLDRTNFRRRLHRLDLL